MEIAPAGAKPVRNPAVDLVRVAAIVVVVLGHWLMQGLWVEDGELHRSGLLSLAPWTHPLTWVLQVMPLVFLVGGFANATSWRSAREHQASYGAWLASRTTRLSRPLVPLLLTWAAIFLAAPVVGLEESWVWIASRAALVPTWFLAVYLVVVALTPATLALWDRWGAWSLLGAVVGAGAIDLLSVATGDARWGFANVAFVWLGIHQLGFAWCDGFAGRRQWLRAVGAASVVALVALVALGPYAVSMVGVSGFGVDNTYPPRITLLLLGLAQGCLVLLLERVLARAGTRPVVSALVVIVGARAMTVYLWHMTALGLLAALSLTWQGAGLQSRPDTAAWWWSRPAWCVALVVTTGCLVRILGRWDARPSATAPDRVATPTATGWTILRIVVVSGSLCLLIEPRLATGHPAVAAALALLPVLAHLLLRPASAEPAPASARVRERAEVTSARDRGP